MTDENDTGSEADGNAQLAAALQLIKRLGSLPEGPGRELFEALDSGLTMVEEYRRQKSELAAQARARGSDQIVSDLLESQAIRYAKVTEQDFRVAAADVIQALADAIETGETDDVMWLAPKLQQRRRRRWLKACEVGCAYLRKDLRPPTDILQAQIARSAEQLPAFLGTIDRRGRQLSGQQITCAIESYVSGVIESFPGLAARLACDCGAFDCTDFVHAKDAFRKL